MRSKHVIEIYDIIVTEKKSGENKVSIIEEYLPGTDLWNLHQEELEDIDLLKVLYQIAKGIADIHEARIIHRDIKPNNMKFDAEGLIKIFDFGLARMEGVSDHTVGFKGTHGFAAPELYKKKKVGFTKKIDVFAYGASVRIILNGKLPKELKKTPPEFPSSSVRDIRPTLPNAVVEILDNTLAFRPKDRPNIQEIRDLLIRYLLKDRHRGVLCYAGGVYEFSKPGQNAKVRVKELGGVVLNYDGLVFYASNIDGDVYVNNVRINDGYIFSGSCVITLGGPEQGRKRHFLTFDHSHPEVVL